MQTPRRLLLIGPALALAMWHLPAVQAAGPEAVDMALQKPAPQLRPIERAFEKIRLGMPAKEMFALMKPFEEVDTGHYQWRTWTDGQTVLHVSLGNFLEDGPHPVTEKSMYRKVFEGGEARWVLVNMTPQCLVFSPERPAKSSK